MIDVITLHKLAEIANKERLQRAENARLAKVASAQRSPSFISRVGDSLSGWIERTQLSAPADIRRTTDTVPVVK